jgi:hypothetical protein
LPIRLLDHYVEPLFVASAVAGIVIGLITPQAWLDDPAGGSQWLLVLAIWLPVAVIGAPDARRNDPPRSVAAGRGDRAAGLRRPRTGRRDRQLRPDRQRRLARALFLAQYDPLFGAKIGAAADISKTLSGG